MALDTEFAVREPLSKDSDEGDDLSFEQIQDLLKQAETKLREKAQVSKFDTSTALEVSKLKAGELPHPYIQKQNGIAKMDSSRSAKDKDRAQANYFRQVEDPVVLKKRLAEVCLPRPHEYALYDEKILSFHPMQDQVPFWAPPCDTERLNFHSYSDLANLLPITTLFDCRTPLTVYLQEKKATAGPLWHDMPRTVVTPELKRDLQLLRMRNVLDPHRHYKKDDKPTPLVPEYSQVGTVIEGPTEFFNARINKKDRKRTLVEEVLAEERESKRFKKKYGEVQKSKMSGKKAFYKSLKEKRKGKHG